jgi:acyl-CoA synthetase (AMP-forming)/AMP-acid ligase II
MGRKDDRAQRRQLSAGDPSVLETAVIGVPDKKWGEVVVAYVQPRPSLTVDPAALETLAARSLSGYKQPTSCRCASRRLDAIHLPITGPAWPDRVHDRVIAQGPAHDSRASW